MSTIGRFEWEHLATPTRTSSHPHRSFSLLFFFFFFLLPLYSVLPVSQLPREWASAKKKKEGEGGGCITSTIGPHRIILCDDINLIKLCDSRGMRGERCSQYLERRRMIYQGRLSS